MRHLYRNIAIIAIVLVVFGLSIFPPEKNLRLGRDLAGGVSLVYTVDVPPDETADTVIPQVIQVLQERINPNGLYEISFVRQGRERLVISMPLPSQRVQELRQAYEDELAKLEGYTFDTASFERAMRRSGDQRVQALNELMGDEPGRIALLEPVREAVIEAERARAAYAEAEALLAGTEEPTAEQREELESLEDAAVDAEIALDEARSRALRLRVSPSDMREAFNRSDVGARLRDEEADEYVEIPSPRERALSTLESQLAEIGGQALYDSIVATHDEYLENRTGLDDPDDLERLLSGSGVLEFRITATQAEVAGNEQEWRRQLREEGPNAVEMDGFVWSPINKVLDWVNQDAGNLRAIQEDAPTYFRDNYGIIVEERPEDGQFYVLLNDSSGMRLTQQEGDWSLAKSFTSQDQLGRPAIGFRMDARGADRLGALTGANVGRNMAILLDGRVYTAPRLRARISNQGVIEGNFSQRELQYIIQTLNAGSLQASLSDEPISRSVLAPELGLDNLKKGLEASVIALILVGIFMTLYYFTSGLVAMIALVCNAVIILGAMSLNRAAFTLPGIAGIVLTFGMAVDANVLIYERIREELLAGEDPKAAVRVAYQKVLSTIVDANVTNLIVCIVLAYTASQEIKGFAITLGIGVVATMFSALLITRVIFSVLIDKLRVAPLMQLPTAAPVIDRILTPKINWIGLRPVFVLISVGLMGMGIAFMSIQQEKMLDTEFLGGTQIDLRLSGEDGGDLTLTRSEVEERVDGIVAAAEDRLATGDAAPERISGIDYTVRESETGRIVARRSNVAPDDTLRRASTYSDVVDWLDDQGALGTEPPLAFRLEGGPEATGASIEPGSAVLLSDDGSLRVELTIDRVSPDVLLSELRNAEVVAVNPEPDGISSTRFQIKTTVTDAELVQDAVVSAFEDVVDTPPALRFDGSQSESFRGALVRPILEASLGANIGEPQITNDVAPYERGVVIVLENLEPRPTLKSVRERLEYVRRQAVYASDALARPHEVIVLDGTNDAVERAAIVVRDGAYDPANDTRFEQFMQQEWDIARTALAESQTLAGVESFSPEIAATFRNQAIVAVVLSFMLITMYIWARFGSVRYSLAALSCLVHDVIIAIGLIALAEIIYERIPAAAAIGIQPFKIDLGLVAAILTIIGYSLNDTIIILDRIRENRGKLAYASKQVVNLSINQTISRTLITSTTTLLALIVMFVIGGEGIASFTYALICGVIIGTYSSIAVAAPLVYTSKIPAAAKAFRDRYGEKDEDADVSAG
ncbi:MAG: hypothetical protein Tsb0013_18480 [Phycisphaerales bacterium]